MGGIYSVYSVERQMLSGTLRVDAVVRMPIHHASAAVLAGLLRETMKLLWGYFERKVPGLCVTLIVPQQAVPILRQWIGVFRY
jgi:hypothetical protein